MVFRFQQFQIYKNIRLYIKEIYQLTSLLPKEERFCLIEQLRRAAISIALNIAEGAGKSSDADFNRFILISIGSVYEIVAILDICLDQKYINQAKYDEFVIKSENIVKQLYGFSKTLKSTFANC